MSKDPANPVAYVQLGMNSKVLRAENRAYDSLHLTTAGYKVLAVEIYDKIVPMMVNVEWRSWKGKLKGKLPEHERAMKASEEEVRKRRYIQCSLAALFVSLTHRHLSWLVRRKSSKLLEVVGNI